MNLREVKPGGCNIAERLSLEAVKYLQEMLVPNNTTTYMNNRQEN